MLLMDPDIDAATRMAESIPPHFPAKRVCSRGERDSHCGDTGTLNRDYGSFIDGCDETRHIIQRCH